MICRLEEEIMLRVFKILEDLKSKHIPIYLNKNKYSMLKIFKMYLF